MREVDYKYRNLIFDGLLKSDKIGIRRKYYYIDNPDEIFVEEIWVFPENVAIEENENGIKVILV